MRILRLFLVSAYTLISLNGCSGIAKGVAEAVMDKTPEDTRMCNITGPAFDGVKDSLDGQGNGKSHYTKVLMVHGIGKHMPGYSASFREKLIRELGLDQTEAHVKEIKLLDAEERKGTNSHSAGILRVHEFSSSVTGKALIFYELTWSGINDKDKEVIAYDDSEAYNYRRAGLNKSLKEFMNATVPDVLAYEGQNQPLINKAVGQSICWMFKKEWDDLPEGQKFCDYNDNNLAKNIKADDYFVVTHSLGSRITIDTFNNFSTARETCTNCTELESLHQALKNEQITVFMLANQLPFLQVGRPKPHNAGMTGEYCEPTGKKYGERLIAKTRIVAFSDPNDILSYPIPDNYADEYIDSSTCPEVVNVDINVVQTSDIFGLIDYADPLAAHSGYFQDERIIKIIASGLKKNKTDPLVESKCHWTETVKKTTKK